MNRHFSLVLVLIALLFSESLSASGGGQSSLETYKQKDYFLKKAKLELAKRSRKQLKLVLKQTHLFHVEDWKKERQAKVESLSRRATLSKREFQDYVTTRNEGL